VASVPYTADLGWLTSAAQVSLFSPCCGSVVGLPEGNLKLGRPATIRCICSGLAAKPQLKAV